MINLLNDRQMEDLEPIYQARKAILHVLGVIKDNPKVGYHMGLGSQSFALLTEAASTLFNEPDLEKLRRHYTPKEEVEK